MTQEQIQSAYQSACAEFGHLTLNKRAIDARILELEAQISKLNELAGKLKADSVKKLQEDSAKGSQEESKSSANLEVVES